MTDAKINVDVPEGKIESAYVKAFFDEAKEALEKDGFRICSLQEIARLRMQEGASYREDGSYSRSMDETLARESFLYFPKKGIYLIRNSPIIDYPIGAVKAHREHQRFFLTDGQVEKAITDCIQVDTLIRREREYGWNVKNYGFRYITIGRLADDPITNFAFGEDAQRYSQFLESLGISNMIIFLPFPDSIYEEKWEEGRPFVEPITLGRILDPFDRIAFKSDINHIDGLRYTEKCNLDGVDHYFLGNERTVRGVRENRSAFCERIRRE